MESLLAIAQAVAAELKHSDFIDLSSDAGLHDWARKENATIAYISPDDLLYFHGKADDELGLGTDETRALWVDADMVLPIDTDGDLLGLDDLSYFINIKALESLVDAYRGAVKIDVTKNASATWRLSTKAPHACFEVYDGDRLHCVGIVFNNPAASWNG